MNFGSLAIPLVIAAGISLVIQNLIMVRITNSASTVLITLVLNSSVGIVLLSSLLLWRNGFAGFSETWALLKWWAIFPGVLGSFFVFASITGYQNLGAANTIALLVASQLISGFIVDALRAGRLNLTDNFLPILGIVLLVIGAYLVAHRKF